MKKLLKFENIGRIVDKTDKLWWKQDVNENISVELLTKRTSFGLNSAEMGKYQ